LHKQYRVQKYSPDHYTGPTSSAVTAQLWPPKIYLQEHFNGDL